MKRVTSITGLLIGFLLISSLAGPQAAEAGIFDADNEVTYKEYWIDHDEFTAHCLDNGDPSSPSGSWYVEPGPLDECPKTMTFYIPDTFTGALKAEIYLDLWRNRDNPSARFVLNNAPTVYSPDAGSDWSRTPWVREVDMTELTTGFNTITFWGEQNYHIHDVAIRIYHDAGNPLIPGIGSETTPPDGSLLTIQDDLKTVNASAGGRLIVNGDKLLLKANVIGAAYVEFHAHYDGYDVDNNGEFRDWQNIARNNWCPGGRETDDNPLGDTSTSCTINHIGTVVPEANGDASVIWDLPYIINQPGVKFKIRAIDENGNVMDAAGGESAEFILARNNPVIYYTIPDFEDFGLHISGNRPDEVLYHMELPPDLNLNEFGIAYFIGAYWKKPKFTINDLPKAVANPGTDSYELGVKQFNVSALVPGTNNIRYYYSTGTGQFIENPGPMIVLKRTSGLVDTAAPFYKSSVPVDGATDINARAPIVVHLADLASGVNYETVAMTVNGSTVSPEISGTSIDTILTYTPPGPLPYQTPIPVTIYGCDMLGNCMTAADSFSFTTGDPDTTAPVISDLLVSTTDTGAVISWKTDEPADSKVAYGLDASYGTTASDASFKTSHSIELTGLPSDTIFHYQITSADQDNNSASTLDQTFKTKQPPGEIRSDDFNACKLDDDIWTYIDPVGDVNLEANGQTLTMEVPAGTNHDIWKFGINAPRIMQQIVNDDFEVETRFDSAVTQKTQMHGILVQEDDLKYLRFNFQSDGNATNIVVVDGGNGNPEVVFSQVISSTVPNYMQIERTANLWDLRFSADGNSWQTATTITKMLNVSNIGPFVGNTSNNPAYDGVIDYFYNTASLPVSVSVAGGGPGLDVVIDGGGTVIKDPDKPFYDCNDSVELTAVPDTDWEFTGWSGDLAGASPTETLFMDESKQVTATFSNFMTYTLSVNESHLGNGTGGTASWQPVAPFYPYGTQITMTADVIPGWSFDGWSGDFISTNLVDIFTIEHDSEITANFSEDHYLLDVQLANDGVGTGGVVTVDPQQTDYLYGQLVTLTATANTGWQFMGWEGDLSGTDMTQKLTMIQDILAIARFEQDQHNLTIDIVSQPLPGQSGPGGTVIKDPDKATYGYGETVQLTADPFSGWEFTGWSGALTGSNLVEPLTILKDEGVTATFKQVTYSLNVTTVGPGSVAIDPDKASYLFGEIVKLTAEPEAGYEFAGWSGDLTGTGNPAAFPVERNYNITATFIEDTTPIEIIDYDVEILNGGLEAQVTFETDIPGTGRVDFGLSDSYGSHVIDNKLATKHTLLLKGLKQGWTYHFQISSISGKGDLIQTPDDSFVARTTSGLVSDDFSTCGGLNTAIWQWVDPLGDSSRKIANGKINISVPEGVEHNLWVEGNNSARIVQTADNNDFVIEVKFDSDLEGRITMQGILIEEDDRNFMRFDFFKRDEGIIVVFAAAFNDLTPDVKANPKIAELPAPLWMRIVRVGDTWQQYYSFDGVTFTPTTAAPIEHKLNVKKVGVYAANAERKNEIPAHTATVDYFFNKAAPIVDEDGRYTISTTTIGQGNIEMSPDQAGYYCGAQVDLTAEPAKGWTFAGWAGDLSGTNPNQTLIVKGLRSVTAIFRQDGEPDEYTTLMPVIRRN